MKMFRFEKTGKGNSLAWSTACVMGTATACVAAGYFTIKWCPNWFKKLACKIIWASKADFNKFKNQAHQDNVDLQNIFRLKTDDLSVMIQRASSEAHAKHAEMQQHFEGVTRKVVDVDNNVINLLQQLNGLDTKMNNGIRDLNKNINQNNDAINSLRTDINDLRNDISSLKKILHKGINHIGKKLDTFPTSDYLSGVSSSQRQSIKPHRYKPYKGLPPSDTINSIKEK